MHNAEGAREAILNAGEEVFAEHGFDGARIDAIARVSGYNKSLIFQYFGDKLGLYGAVIRRADEQTRAMQNEALPSLMQGATRPNPDQVGALLGKYVGWYFDYLVEHPRIQRIYVWEMAEGWQTMSKVFTQRDYDDLDEFAPVLAKLQESGLLRSGLHPLLQVSTALFATALYLALPPLYKTLLLNVDLSSPAALAQARDFVVDFVVHGLLITPAEAKSGRK
ncbi:MAG TPA: TetR/AcrR family transcriptional regulator [Anaerolineales bacterium]|nr:TetR/AcrR family transcriptional regulator [Anaerolineales bacterium]